MKKVFLLIHLLCTVCIAVAQINTDSTKRKLLKSILDSARDDSTRFKLIDSVWVYIYSNPDSALKYIQQNILLSQKMKSDVALSISYGQYGALEQINGNYPGALLYRIQSLRAAERTNNFILIAGAYNALGDVYKETEDFKKAISNIKKAKSLYEANWKPTFETDVDYNTVYTYFQILRKLAETYERFHQSDSALIYANYLYDAYLKVKGKMDWPGLLFVMGNIYAKLGRYSSALDFYRTGAGIAVNTDIKSEVMENYSGMAKVFKTTGEIDSSIHYAKKVLEVSKVARNIIVKMEALNLLADAFKLKHNNDSVAKYLDLTIVTKDSLFSQQKIMQLQSIAFNEQLRQREIQDEQERYFRKIRSYLLIGGLAILLLVTALLYRNNRHKQKANMKIEKAYQELKGTQAQLIQSAKMASLGELTAGIAHEIQNPLNFVNNFSEVTNELIEELKSEKSKIKNERDEELENDLLNDIQQNLEKIHHHGKRADAIVKGMLQHSQARSGQKEPTDINKLADEYLRLAYHGWRGKDNSFDAALKTDFDESIGSINIIPQEIGRVLLNLYNNAFYAVTEKKKQQGEGFDPMVSVSTKKMNDKVEIIIKDNGNGIPQKVIDKIFQPFFTTKPTGQGTGLGLSLSYDIVKAHGGEIKVETKVGEGTAFIIVLPV